MILQNLNRVGGLGLVLRFVLFKFLTRLGLKTLSPNSSLYRELFQDKSGIEIGGPSAIFNQLSIYSSMKSLDGCNYSTSTVWEGQIKEGEMYRAGDKTGYQYIAEASDLSKISDNKYDFLISSHCLEHCANALRTVKEWVRVVKPGGIVLMILPNKNFTFDHNRSITSFEHLVDDYNRNVGEDDLTHLDEIIKLHDLAMDKQAGRKEEFKSRSLNNLANRCLHHHVFDLDLLEKSFDFCGVTTIHRELIMPYHQIIIGKKN
jgi:SAM-dependent methyltransferase